MISTKFQARIIAVAQLFIFVFLISSITQAQPTTIKIDADERKFVVGKIAELIIENYVYPDVGEKTAAFIQKQLGSGAYDDIKDASAFARMLTVDLQSTNKDKHMRVRVPRSRPGAMEPEDPEITRIRGERRSRENNYGFEKVDRLEGNVGYLDFRYFSDNPEARKPAAGALEFLANTDAVIVDMRKNGGGSPRMVQFVCSYFFGEKTHLNSLYWRRGDRTDEYWTLDEIPGTRMPDVPIFVLTSRRTFSGAEEFTYNFKTRKRATIVGEVTGGGANPGGTRRINEHFNIFIPTGRAINPVTGTNWEGVGVKPDVFVPADSALVVAHRLAKNAAETFRNKQLEKKISGIKEMRNQLEYAEKLLASNNDETQNVVNSALGKATKKELIGEPGINSMGYDYLRQKKHAMAIIVFKYNTEAYPESFNTYDSLGEAYMENGDKELAIKFYKKSLELNPDNTNGKEMLEKLGVKVNIVK